MKLLPRLRAVFATRQPATFAAPGALTREQATMERVFQLVSTLPDPDEALRRAGIARHQLRAVEMDDEVTAALDTRREAVLGTPWRLEGGTARWRAEMHAELAPHMEALLRGTFSAVPYGYSVVEVVWRNDGGRAGIASLAEKPLEWFIPAADGVNLRWKQQGAGFDGVPVDPRKFLLTVRSGSTRNPYGEALLSRVYWPWFFRQHGWQFWLRWLERYGTPLLLGKTAGDPQVMADNLAAALAGSAMAVGQGDDVQAIAPGTGAGHFESFDAAICRRIQKLMLGQTLTTDASTGGSFAAAKVADGVRTDRRNADLRLVAGTVQRLVNALWQFNGRNGEPPTFVMADDTGLEVERAARDAVLVEKVGVRLTPAYIAQRYDLEPGDFTMADLDAAAPAAGGAPAMPMDGQQPTAFMVGDTVQVKPGANHDEMTKDATGTIMEISTPALGIQFDGMPMLHKWYVDDEVMAAEASDDDDPDATSTSSSKKKARPMRPMRMAASGGGQHQFTPVQQGIEDGLAALDAPEPIPPDLVRAAVLAARDEADLRARLAALVSEADPRFQQALERASFAAAVLGYVAADELRA